MAFFVLDRHPLRAEAAGDGADRREASAESDHHNADEHPHGSILVSLGCYGRAVDAELKRRVGALRRPPELAAQNDFAGVRRVQGLGNVLRVACDGLLQKWASEQLAAWRVVLAKWE